MTKAEATKEGKALLARMKGVGWKLRVWENCGWHYSVLLGTIYVYGSPGCFNVLFSADKKIPGAGEIFWTTRGEHYKDPNRAVEMQLKCARTFVNKCSKAIEDVERGLNAKKKGKK